MSDIRDEAAAAAATTALRRLADQAEQASPPRVAFIIGDGRLRRRRRNLLAGLAVASAAVATAVTVPLAVDAHSSRTVLAPVTTAPTCPDESRSTAEPPRASEPGAGGRLVPGHPSVATVCWYRRVEAARVIVLDRSAVLQGAELATLVARLDSTPTGAGAGGGDVSCPEDDLGGEPFVRAFFAYPGNRSVAVYTYLTGCRNATNGSFATTPDATTFDGF